MGAVATGCRSSGRPSIARPTRSSSMAISVSFRLERHQSGRTASDLHARAERAAERSAAVTEDVTVDAKLLTNGVTLSDFSTETEHASGARELEHAESDARPAEPAAAGRMSCKDQ